MYYHYIILYHPVTRQVFRYQISFNSLLVTEITFHLLDYQHNHLDSQTNFEDQIVRRQA
jgi:hypothetical protein